MRKVIGGLSVLLAAVLMGFGLSGPASADQLNGWEEYGSPKVTVANRVITMDATDGGTNIGKNVDTTVRALSGKIGFKVTSDQGCTIDEDVLVVLYLAEGTGNLSGHVQSCGVVTEANLAWYRMMGPASDPMRWGGAVRDYGDEPVTRIELATVKTGMVARFENVVLGEEVCPAEPTTRPTATREPVEPTVEPTATPGPTATAGPTPPEPTLSPSGSPSTSPTGPGVPPTSPSGSETPSAPPAGGSGGGGRLPLTGPSVVWFLAGGAALIVGGAVLFLATRREEPEGELA